MVDADVVEEVFDERAARERDERDEALDCSEVLESELCSGMAAGDGRGRGRRRSPMVKLSIQ